MRSLRFVTTAAAALCLAGGCVRYHAQPLRPEESEAAFARRSLADAGVVEVGRPRVADEPATQPASTRPAVASVIWDLESLTRAALYLHPDMAVARAHAATVRAGERTAGEMPNPTFSFAPEYATNPGGITPWILGGALDVPIETAGKRGIRMDESRALTAAARLELDEAAWRVRGRVRDALAEYLFVQDETALWDKEVKSRTAYVAVLEARLEAGEAGRAEVDVARIDLLTARQARRAAEGRRGDAAAKLAGAIGIPVGGLEGATFVWPGVGQFAPLDEGAARSLQAAGLLNRMDVRRALAEYAAAEAALRLEVAKQYPDVHLSPGYQFDQGTNKIQLGFSLTLPVFNQNGGAIGEAAARRAELGGKFLALQAQVIGETESAVARYRSALGELAEADSQIEVLGRQLAAGRRALEAGEQDRLTVSGIELQQDVASRLRLDAVRKAQSARGAIEDAVQRPLSIRVGAETRGVASGGFRSVGESVAR